MFYIPKTLEEMNALLQVIIERQTGDHVGANGVNKIDFLYAITLTEAICKFDAKAVS